MKLAETTYDNHETGCCAPVDPARWDGRTLHWEERPFVRDRIRSFFHVPLNFGAVAARCHAAVEAVEGYPEEPFWLSDEVSKWRSDFYLSVDRPVLGAETVTLSGTFLTRVFEGPYRDAGRWIRAMREHVESQGYRPVKILFFYATCPRCAKHFGKNQVVLFAQVA